MEYFTLEIGEKITIDGNITLALAKICYNQARLAINAPREIPIHRKEVQDAINTGMSYQKARKKRR